MEYINKTRACHVITIEDPIEYRYKQEKATIHQRELGRDVPSFHEALRSALREDPDVILIGEMRDYETISLAMMAAETGHLVFGTLHTSSAAQTIDRIIDVCPIHAQARCATSFQICFRALSRRASFRALTGMGASLRLRSCSARTR